MAKIAARYFDGKTSTAQEVEVELTDDGAIIVRGALPMHYLVDDIDISPRIGNTPRRIQFADGAACETHDNDSLDRWLARGGAQGAQHHVYHLERHWSYALAAVLIVAVVTWAFIQYGVPALAERLAQILPPSVDDRLGKEALQAMDDKLFAPTQLSGERQQSIRELFHTIVVDLPAAQRYRLIFRHGGKVVGANAFALPSGQVVMTDELVELSQSDNELIAVLAHEVGHVVHRHAVRMVLQSSASALVMLGVLGDVSSVSSLAATLPAVLTQAKYSRAHETEADNYAYAWMRAHGVAAHYFGDILNRLEQQEGGSLPLGYFSSHPPPSERSHAE